MLLTFGVPPCYDFPSPLGYSGLTAAKGRCCIKADFPLAVSPPKGGMLVREKPLLKLLRFMLWLGLTAYILTVNAR